MGHHHGKLNILPSNYQYLPITCSQLIVNWLLGNVSENVPPLWNLSYKEVKHKNNGMRTWKIIATLKIVMFAKHKCKCHRQIVRLD